MIEIHCSKPSECKYLLYNPIYTYHIARTNQLIIFEIYRTSNNFIIKGDATDFIKKWADSKGVEILSLELQSIDDIMGERVIVTNVATPHFYNKVWWLDMVSEHADKKYLMLIYVDKADVRTINALKSYIENKPENLFYGIICRDTKKKINSTINGLCFIHIWENDEDGNC